MITTLTAIIVNNGSNFDGDTIQYSNEIINCVNHKDCNITCSSGNCDNTTVYCPAELNTSCSITCTNNNACDYMDIIWIPANSNSLKCLADWACSYVAYPPPINDYTPYEVICNDSQSCRLIFITCPDHASCYIECSGDESCNNVVIHCPSTATCSVNCTS